MSNPNIVNDGAGPTSNKTTPELLDSENLILMEVGKTIWQSFDYPTDTLLHGMSLGLFNNDNADRERKQYLLSWLSPSDPNRAISSCCKSDKILLSHSAALAASRADIYSASAVDNATVLSVFDDQEIGFVPKQNKYPEVLSRSSTEPAQSQFV
nr:uncharacterized protein LOC112489696 [Ziziphus jujuba var. spinosa]